MRIVVTGAAGFIGSNLTRELLTQGHEVVGIDAFLEESYPAGLKWANLASIPEGRNFTFHQVDLRTYGLEAIVDGADAIINEAAMPGLFPSWDYLDLYVSNNVVAMGRLLDAARATGVDRFIQISTSSVYGRNAIGNETQATEPTSPYGVTKLAAEKLLLAYVENFDFPGMILRYFSVYGPGQRPDMAYNIFSEALIDDREIVLFGDGTQSRSNTFIDDCVEGTINAVENFQQGGIYNIAGATSIRLIDALEILADEIGTRPRVRWQERAPGDQYETHGDISRAADAFGYNPSTDPETGLRRQAAWQVGRRAVTSTSRFMS